MRFQEKLINLRKANGLTQEQLAEKLSVSRQAVSRWEAGDSAPDMYNLQAICRYFGVSADYLINDDLTSENDTPLAQKKDSEIQQEKQNRKNMHLIAGVCFVIAWMCAVYGLINAEIGIQLLLSAISCVLTAVCAAIQFVCYFRK